MLTDNKQNLIKNYEHLKSLSHSKVLMTSRAKIDNIYILKVDHLDLGSSKKLFQKNEEKILEELLSYIDFHTLMIELLAKVGKKNPFQISELLEI